jgi:D-ribose pyranose/furanose isomerase RbsD
MSRVSEAREHNTAEFVPHERLKELTHRARTLIRTGEATALTGRASR